MSTDTCAWQVVKRNDIRARLLADRHYSRQKPGSPGFTPPGRVLILLTHAETAVWATSFPFAQYVHRVSPDAWTNCLFRNEGEVLSSELIRQAVAITRWRYGEPPPSGMVTMIDRSKVRKKRDWGRCYRRAGFEEAGETKGGLLIMRLAPEKMPAALTPEVVP